MFFQFLKREKEGGFGPVTFYHINKNVKYNGELKNGKYDGKGMKMRWHFLDFHLILGILHHYNGKVEYEG